MQSTTGMTLALTAEEVALLDGLLSNDLGNLREEVYKTENYDMREALKRREMLLRNLQARIHGSAA